jgi:hypothetical protein
VGRCELKLGANALNLLRSQVKWNQPSTKADVSAIMRRLALEYVTGYLEGGNEKLAVYRDTDRPTFVANEFRAMIDHLPPLDQHLPETKRYLLEYPRVSLPDSTDFLYWQETQFGLKPTIRISHVLAQPHRFRTRPLVTSLVTTFEPSKRHHVLNRTNCGVSQHRVSGIASSALARFLH